jgi:protein O-GlcNAc transferase
MPSKLTNLPETQPAPELSAEQIGTMMGKGLTFLQGGHLAKAQEIYEEVLTAQPDNADALHLLGIVVSQASDAQRGADLIIQAIKIQPGNADFHSNLGLVLAALGQFDAAITNYEIAIEAKPDFVEAHNNRGLALSELGKMDEAVASYETAISLNPNFANAYSNFGIVLAARGKSEAAIASYDKAIALNPSLFEAHSNRGIALAALGQLDGAVASYDKALETNPAYADAYYNRGNALKQLKRFDAAVASYKKALEINPGYPFLDGMLLHTMMEICDWEGFDARLEALKARVERNEKATPSLDLHGLCDLPSLHRLATEIWMKSKHPPNLSLGAIPKRLKGDKIRVGYYSADFRVHAVSQLVVELFESHDRNNFELIAFSLRPDAIDEMSERVAAAFDRFIEVKKQSDQDVAQLSRDLGIDIAVDLGGLTSGHRPGIFAYRAAPIQVNYLGFGGTMAAEYYDYLVADRTIIPPASQKLYSEKIVYLPSHQASAMHRNMAERIPTREELGLPSAGFIYCCFNNNIKITPSTFEGWMRILKKVESSALFLNARNNLAISNLKRETSRHGVSPERVIFKKLLSAPNYLAMHQTVGLFLDTFPYNAGTTASDALWAGLPVLTLKGESFASRLASSVLNVIRLPELITLSQEEYESRAIELATNPSKLAEIKGKLQKNRNTSVLFDSRTLTRHIEAAYTVMYERYHADLLPDHIEVLKLD